MRQVLPDVHEVFFPGALVNAFVVLADVPTLIDTGTPGGSTRLLGAAGKAGIAARDVGRIILTHRHADHASNAAQLAAATGAEVHASPIDGAFVSESREQPRPRPTTPMGRLLVPYVKVALPWRLDTVRVTPDLEDGAHVGPFHVVATPGHTAGHVSLLWEERGVLFTGDAAANITAVGPHPANDEPDIARQTFDRLAELEFESACFGHGRTIRTGAAAKFSARRAAP